MKHIPGGREVERALKSLVREIGSALKETNQQAGKLLTRGDYAGAEGLVAIARSVSEFQKEVEALRSRWFQVGGGSSSESGSNTPATPLWRYYTPTLRAIIALGGVATRADIERHLETGGSFPFPEGDTKSLGGRPRWKVMVHRSLPAMVKQGFVERHRKEWRITAAGKTAAAAEPAETSLR